ncbi:hypothetical protein CPC08DRAFT_821472 [Agrocybe pediades]|nr:hypothetical protein CPC08DRAFT_821472 [Agrocybe pediades]
MVKRLPEQWRAVGYSIPGIQTLLSRKKSIAPPQSISPNIRLLSNCTPPNQTPEESSPGLGWACFLLKRAPLSGRRLEKDGVIDRQTRRTSRKPRSLGWKTQHQLVMLHLPTPR